MDYDFLRYAVDQGVASITLSRPDVLNAFNKRMAQELQRALGVAAKDDAVRAVMLTGNGRGFCAGQDLAEATAGYSGHGSMADLGDIVATNYSPSIIAIRELEKPVVAAVNGVAAGAGANLALACDIVVAAEDASFIQSFTKIGLVPDTGGTFFLPRLVGPARATALMMLADKVSASKALEWGMIYQVVPSTVLIDTAMSLAKQLANMPTRALGLTKRALNASMGSDYRTALATEEKAQREAGKTADYLEGVRAFLEKRKPTYTGK
jgi:2-(1,2-epoxy-1,2-dihydrophenyl)acetyl-CoA isomerase